MDIYRCLEWGIFALLGLVKTNIGNQIRRWDGHINRFL